ncbi:MAG: hypothetical protein CXT73_03970 [Methanobacteriota archaeon]|nr:MAG: hypothetical protein CXT73_03970 [Euryarchaeota archaeon]
MTKTRKKRHKKLNFTKSKFRSPTSLSIFPERSPQLQDKEPNVLNAFTTKNIRVKDKHGQQWNTVENNKLAYKRSARGAPIGSYPKVIYGSRVDRLTKKNYKKLKKGVQLYYDRNSVVFRGPFTYQKTIRGPNLLLTASDIGYRHNIYKFVIPVSKLKNETLYFETGRHLTKKRTKKKSRKKRKKRKKRKRSKN